MASRRDVVLAVLRGYGLESTDAIHATRIIRSSLHGFASLEARKGFGLPLEIDETFARLTQLLDQGLPHARADGGGRVALGHEGEGRVLTRDTARP